MANKSKVDRFDKFTISANNCGSVSGSAGYSPILLNAENVTLYVCILTNNRVYIRPCGGKLTWSGTGLSHGHKWPIRMIGNTKSFTGKIVRKDLDFYSPVLLPDVTDWSSTSCVYQFDALSDDDTPEEGKILNSSWNKYVTNSTIAKWSKVDGEASKRAYYVAFPAHNNGGDVNKITYSSVRITLESDIFDSSYFPGEVYRNGSWKSCNRKKSGNNEAGYFKAKRKGVWTNRKNLSGNTEKSTVFINDTIAPKF